MKINDIIYEKIEIDNLAVVVVQYKQNGTMFHNKRNEKDIP